MKPQPGCIKKQTNNYKAVHGLHQGPILKQTLNAAL